MVNGEVGSFFSYDDYLNYTNKKNVMMLNYNDYNFNFYDMSFSNGTKIYLFNSLDEARAFKKYFNMDSTKVPFVGLIVDVLDRFIMDGVGKSVDEFVEICKDLAEERKYMIIFIPSYVNPYDNL